MAPVNPTWIEAAVNGPWGASRQPGSPTTVQECIEAGIACAEAGAAIIHVHAFDPAADEQRDDPEIYSRIIKGITDSVDAIVYPTIPPLGLVGEGTMSASERYAHIEELGDSGLLDWTVIDPGSVHFTTYEAVRRDHLGSVYENPEAHIRTGLEVAGRYGSTPSFAIYEPGFVRLGTALAERYPAIGTPVYRFMFTDDYTFNYPPEPYALESLLRLLADEAGDVPWMVSGLGVDITRLIPAAVDRGGHVRVGLEDAPLGTDRDNVEWVTRARREIKAAGGTIASADDVRSELDWE